MERIILIGILLAAVAGMVIMLRRSFTRSTETGGCAGCPMAGGCEGQTPQDSGGIQGACESWGVDESLGVGTRAGAGASPDPGKGATS